MPNSKISKVDKAVISGHYIFSDINFLEIKNEINSYLLKKNINLDKILQKSIEKSIYRYVQNFNLIKK